MRKIDALYLVTILATAVFQTSICFADPDGCNDSSGCSGNSIVRTVLDSQTANTNFSGTAQFVVTKLTVFDSAGVFTKDFLVDADHLLSDSINSAILYAASLPAQVSVTDVDFDGRFHLSSGGAKFDKSVQGSFHTHVFSPNPIAVLKSIQLSDFSSLANPGVALNVAVVNSNVLERVDWTALKTVSCERHISESYELTPPSSVSDLIRSLVLQNSSPFGSASTQEVDCP
jgi:hypothetical protein